jgi:hypothetical protein
VEVVSPIEAIEKFVHVRGLAEEEDLSALLQQLRRPFRLLHPQDAFPRSPLFRRDLLGVARQVNPGGETRNFVCLQRVLARFVEVADLEGLASP